MGQRVRFTVEGTTIGLDHKGLDLAALTALLEYTIDRWPGMELTEPCYFQRLTEDDEPAIEEHLEDIIERSMQLRFALRDCSDTYQEAVLSVLYPAVTGLPVRAISDKERKRWQDGLSAALSHATLNWKPKETR